MFANTRNTTWLVKITNIVNFTETLLFLNFDSFNNELQKYKVTESNEVESTYLQEKVTSLQVESSW